MLTRIGFVDSTHTRKKQDGESVNKRSDTSRHIVILPPALVHKHDFVVGHHVVLIHNRDNTETKRFQKSALDSFSLSVFVPITVRYPKLRYGDFIGSKRRRPRGKKE